jgi:hypothetical protein
MGGAVPDLLVGTVLVARPEIPLNGFGTDKINSPLHSLWQSFHNILSRRSADCSP